MRLTAILVLGACLQVAAKGKAQSITLSERNAPIEKVLQSIEKQANVSFYYKVELLQTAAPVTITVKNKSLKQVLDQCFKDRPFSYEVIGNVVVIKAKLVPPVVEAPPQVPVWAPVRITGRVLGESGEQLAGASIRILQKGKLKNIGVTNEKGEFKLGEFEDGIYILEVSFIGYEKVAKEIKVPGQITGVLIVMKKAVSVLDEVQTIAYSNTSMRYNTGDITTINSKEIARNPVPNVLQALQGRVAGMFISETSGMPNGAFQVQIRSVNTLAGTARTSPSIIPQGGQPLYIVDGVEYPASGNLPMQNFPPFGNSKFFGNALNYLDPSLIESINVLKGADATAIYGSRGAYGVILITTKKAKAGKPTVSVNASYGFSQVGKMPEMMNTEQYLEMRRSALANGGSTPGAIDYDLNGTWDTTQSTDWQDFFLGEKAPTTRLNATYTGGSSNASYLLGANYSTIGNIQRSKGSVRAGGMNFNINTATNDRKFLAVLSGSYSTNVDDMVPVDFVGSGGLTMAPNAPYPFLEDGKLNWENNPTNPAAVLNSIYRNATDNLVANTSMTFTPVKGLNFILAGGFNLLTAKEFAAKPSSFFNPVTFTTAQTYSSVNQYRLRTFSADPRVEYNQLLWGKGRLSLTAGGSLRDAEEHTTFISGNGYPTDQLLMSPANASAANISTVYRILPRRYIGAFAILNFRWADKYILALNGRRDGSSVFGNNKQFGNFGSVSGAWILSEEPWFEPLKNIIGFLKLKAGYALVGGSSIGPYNYINTYGLSTNSYGGGISLTPQNLANPYLHWETNKNMEAGLTIDLLKGRINIDAMYYHNRVGDQLTSQPLASITGFTAFTINSPANIHSYGAEITLNTKNISNKNFSWSTRINLTLPRTKLKAYPGIENLVTNVNYEIGKPITGIKLYNYAGVDPATGTHNFYNAQGVRGEFTPFLSPVQLDPVKDRVAFVDLAPKYYGGVLNSLTYKNFSMDFSVTITNRMGPEYLAFNSLPMGFQVGNYPLDISNQRWRKPGDVTRVPKVSTSPVAGLTQGLYVNSTGAYSNATYARLQNLSFSYRLPARLLQKARMAGLSVYVAGQNLYTISKYDNLDPENMQANRMPPLRVYTMGINVTY
ncbi:SusC/RagA family TonB-linked outer membrane protein [Longitalea arenae]|uniref:SusC/RagA family TonB-linked outer membrane protein n=1 Tax=Longitalea arenae TaxID=2812558 RepID=UPI00196739D0|nr:SusC/RagA family TonB-linked outer membrane protein [Longitalea arenae]